MSSKLLLKAQSFLYSQKSNITNDSNHKTLTLATIEKHLSHKELHRCLNTNYFFVIMVILDIIDNMFFIYYLLFMP